MATVDRNIALELLRNEGRYHDDPLPFAIYRYGNRMYGGVDYSICYTVGDAFRLVESPAVSTAVILWTKEGGLTPAGEAEIAKG